MSSMERRKLACSVTFHAVAFTCVIWSLYVLIDRSAEEYSSGQLQWPFWTKLVVVAIGFTGTFQNNIWTCNSILLKPVTYNSFFKQELDSSFNHDFKFKSLSGGLWKYVINCISKDNWQILRTWMDN